MPTNEPTVPVSALLAMLARWERWQAGAEAEGLAAVGNTLGLARWDVAALIGEHTPTQTVCDAQEHETEAEYRACPICNPPFPTS
jgi:hypothetical protein